jgi:hypothetical protein
LADGWATVETARLLPHVRHLKNLTRLRVTLPLSEAQPDLSTLDSLPCLSSILLFLDEEVTVDLGSLRDHSNLDSIFLHFARKFVGVRQLKSLRQLKYLILNNRLPWRDIEAFSELTTVTFLALTSLQRVRSLDPLASLEKLETVVLQGIRPKILFSSTPLVTLRSVVLHAHSKSENIQITGEAIIKCFPMVETLGLYEMAIVDLGSIAAGRHLRKLTLNSLTAPVDLSPLTDLNVTVEASKTELLGVEKLGPGVKLIVS